MGITKNKNLNLKVSENSIIRTIKVPKFYFERREDELSYQEILKDLLHLNPPVIPLGILSAGISDGQEEQGENSTAQPVVFTNPPPDTLVGTNDRIICLGEPGNELTTDNEHDEQKERNLHHQNITKVGIADLWIKTKNQTLNNNNESESINEDDSLDFLFDLMKKRLETPNKLQKDIDKKNKLIAELQREADLLKEKLVAKHQGYK
jgi:hypothetical protein